MDNLNLPKVTFGLPIPQVLSDTEKNSMKTAVNTFMGSRFGVSCVDNLVNTTDIIVERLYKLAREQTHNLGRTHRRKLIRYGRSDGLYFSGVTCVENSRNRNWPCRRTRVSTCIDNATHDVVVLPQPYCSKKC